MGWLGDGSHRRQIRQAWTRGECRRGTLVTSQHVIDLLCSTFWINTSLQPNKIYYLRRSKIYPRNRLHRDPFAIAGFLLLFPSPLLAIRVWLVNNQVNGNENSRVLCLNWDNDNGNEVYFTLAISNSRTRIDKISLHTIRYDTIR